LVEYFDQLNSSDNQYKYSNKYHTAFYWQKSAAGQMLCVLVVAIADTAAAH
jgi:hypothetical protein